ncbi:MAG TPA: hypothetical protein VG028_13440 [Terriglobia bacterium]|nr:hypothetical protein [Terriglobia bacterium]
MANRKVDVPALVMLSKPLFQPGAALRDCAYTVGPSGLTIAMLHSLSLTDWAQLLFITLNGLYVIWRWRRDGKK